MTNSFQLAYLYTVHLSPKNIAPLFGFAGASLTLSKTTIWVLQEHFCGHCSSKDIDPAEILKFWIAPNVLVLAISAGDYTCANTKTEYGSRSVH